MIGSITCRRLSDFFSWSVSLLNLQRCLISSPALSLSTPQLPKSTEAVCGLVYGACIRILACFTCSFSVCSSYGLPGKLLAPTIKLPWSAWMQCQPSPQIHRDCGSCNLEVDSTYGACQLYSMCCLSCAYLLRDWAISSLALSMLKPKQLEWPGSRWSSFVKSRGAGAPRWCFGV